MFSRKLNQESPSRYVTKTHPSRKPVWQWAEESKGNKQESPHQPNLLISPFPPGKVPPGDSPYTKFLLTPYPSSNTKS